MQVAFGMYGLNASLSVTAMFMFYTPSGGAGFWQPLLESWLFSSNKGLQLCYSLWVFPL
jgi:hypothetical protein